MFNVGDGVVYGTHGVFIIKEISNLKLTEKETLYYVLSPVFDSKSTFYLPVEKAAELGSLRAVLNRKEFENIFNNIFNTDPEWISDDNTRKEFCQNAIKSGNREDIIEVIKMLYAKQQELKGTGKHFHVVDERIFRTAEKLLHEEIAYVFNVSVDEVPKFIQSKTKR